MSNKIFCKYCQKVFDRDDVSQDDAFIEHALTCLIANCFFDVEDEE